MWDRRAEFLLCASAATIAEFVEVGSREAIRAKAPQLTDGTVGKVVAVLRQGLYVESPPDVQACRDPHDDKFLACALGAEAGFLVSEDKDLLALDGYRGLRIVSPAEFAEVLERGGDG